MEGLEIVKSIFTFVFAFAFVIALAILSTKLIVANNVKKFKSKSLELLEGISLGPQKSLNVVRFANKALLIAVTRDRVEKIESIDLKEIMPNQDDNENNTQDSSNQNSGKIFDSIFEKFIAPKENKMEDKQEQKDDNFNIQSKSNCMNETMKTEKQKSKKRKRN